MKAIGVLAAALTTAAVSWLRWCINDELAQEDRALAARNAAA